MPTTVDEIGMTLKMTHQSKPKNKKSTWGIISADLILKSSTVIGSQWVHVLETYRIYVYF